MHGVVHRLGDVGRVVADPLEVLGDEQQVRAGRDVARVLHHVGDQLAEDASCRGRRSPGRTAQTCDRLVRRRRSPTASMTRRRFSCTSRAMCARPVRLNGQRELRRARCCAWRRSWRSRRSAPDPAVIFSAATICRRSAAIGWRSASIRITNCSTCRSIASTCGSCSHRARSRCRILLGDGLGRERQLALDHAAHLGQQAAQAIQLLGEALDDVLGASDMGLLLPWRLSRSGR